MLPARFIQRIKHQSYIDAEALINAMEEPLPVSIRINPLRLDKKPLGTSKVPWCETGYYLDSRPSYTLDPLFHAGCYYPQEASGMFQEQVFRQLVNPAVTIKVLDLCGAPGGKSTHLSSLIGRNSLLVSNEVIRSRVGILTENITRWGSQNTLVTQNDPSAFRRLQGYFDIVFVDAPCSGEGMFRNKVAVNEWSEENTAHCSERQKRILMDVWPALRTGGLLIYSTCTFNPDENEKNVKWLISLKDAETIKMDISDFKEVTQIDYQGVTGYGFYPYKVRGEGFFISVIRKTERQDVVPLKKKSISGVKISREDHLLVKRWTNLDAERLIRPGNDIIFIGGSREDYSMVSQYLKIIKAGTRICTIKNRDYLPSHELALSDSIRRGAFHQVNLEFSQALSFLRRDNISLPEAQKGWLLLIYSGVNLGFVNNIGSRANNYYPVNWRIRMNLPEPGSENIIEWEQKDSI
jgi:16S rRNA C967 or C1407 C5-methylase (RsmB/RsmF family)/NOL1/NOP2/fmu family ribosome biogenesis protein